MRGQSMGMLPDDVVTNQGAMSRPITGAARRCQTFHDLLMDVASGLYYIHSCNIIHGGLKGVRNWHESCPAAILTRA